MTFRQQVLAAAADNSNPDCAAARRHLERSQQFSPERQAQRGRLGLSLGNGRTRFSLSGSTLICDLTAPLVPS